MCFETELEEYYSTLPADVADVMAELSARDAAHPEWSPFRRKAELYAVAAERCDVHVFRHFPFCFEIKGGRSRRQWGFGGVGGWMFTLPKVEEYRSRCRAWHQDYQGLVSHSDMDLDRDHHSVGYDHYLAVGSAGLVRECQARLETARTAQEREFLEAAIAGHRCLIAFQGKFAARAEAMLAVEAAPDVRRNLERVAAWGRRAGGPPRTFFEALNDILFIREAIGSLEGVAVSTFGMLDRLLAPFHQPGDDAKALLDAFLVLPDLKFDVASFDGSKVGGDHVETSTTVIIGGCDAAGGVVFNELTAMILDSYAERRLLNPKLNARISPRHPHEYFERLSGLVAQGSNAVVILNDDVIIPANVRQGKAVEDCRLYVGGGCQETLLQNCEVHSRATVWFNLPGTLLRVMRQRGDAVSFEVFYQAFLVELRRLCEGVARSRSANEKDGWTINPCPLHSATLDGCVAKAMDWTEGGAKYSSAALDGVGVGTLVDSLLALKTLVFERRELSLARFLELLDKDFAGEEPFRQRLLHGVPKYGRDDAGDFPTRVFKDVARAMSGFPNGRGGRFEASLFAFRNFVSFGHETGATPDGREAGADMSPGMAPSVQSLGERCGVGQVLDAVKRLDMADYPVVAVLDMKLPPCGPEAVESVVRRFLDCGGSGLQLNVLNQDDLRDAMSHPEAYPGLVVRISGYSAYFAKLPRGVQEELLGRAQLAAS